MKKATFIVEKTNTGYSAYAENYNAATTAKTYKELKKNMLASLNTLLEFEDKPAATEKDVSVKFDLRQFLEFYKEINISALSGKIGINNALISQYKAGLKMPSEKQAQKIFHGIKSYGKELAAIDFA